jgi:hypothetical protein
LLDFSCRDLTVIKVKYHVAGADKDLVLASAYLPYDSPNPPPSEELERLERFCGHLNLQIIIGADANAHHIVWGSSNTKSRGESLLEFIISRKLEVLNRDREPTFITQRQKVVIDITLGSPYISILRLGSGVYPMTRFTRITGTFAWKSTRLISQQLCTGTHENPTMCDIENR